MKNIKTFFLGAFLMAVALLMIAAVSLPTSPLTIDSTGTVLNTNTTIIFNGAVIMAATSNHINGNLGIDGTMGLGTVTATTLTATTVTGNGSGMTNASGYHFADTNQLASATNAATLLAQAGFIIATNAGPISSSQVTTGLGFTPLTNTQVAVLGALTFTPATNAGPISSSQITTGLGYTPVQLAGSNIFTGTNTVTVGTRTFTHDDSHTLITNTATLTGNEWTTGQEKYWYKGTNTILVDKTNGSITLNGTLTATSPHITQTTNSWTTGGALTVGDGITYIFSTNAAATLGITGIASSPTSTAAYGELMLIANGAAITFTNDASIHVSDGLTSRTVTNGNAAFLAVNVVPGQVHGTNAAYVWFP